MDKRRLKTFRDRLLERREGLVGIVEQAEKTSRERDSEATQDPADMAANAYNKELMVSMTENDRKLLTMIDEALIRVEYGEFGRCIRCDEPILDRRLEALPWARYCLNCQDLFEKGLLVDDDE